MLKSSYELMRKAENGGYAIPAFNIDNLESAIAVTNTVKKLHTPVIIQMIPRTLAYGGIKTYPAMINALMSGCDTDYCIHLDHGNNIEILENALAAGFSSVMIDGSALPLNENIAITKQARASSKHFSLEGELGAIGGKEQAETQAEISYTKVDEAIIFVKETKVDSLAIGVGSAHGIYKGIPNINIKRIAEIKEAVPMAPLVLHGATGIPDEIIRETIKAGISKINFATELRLAFTRGLKSGLEKYKDAFDPKIYLPEAIKEIEKAVTEKTILCYNGKI